MAVFNCIITQKSDVTLENIPQWKKLLIARSTPSLSKAYKTILLRYGVTNIQEYIQLVTDALQNNEVDKINENYEKNKAIELNQTLKKEKQTLKTKIEGSISKFNDNITIRMLSEEDEDAATDLYIEFKKTMNEDIEQARYYTQDFILKNIMFGIFVNDMLVGFVIIHYSKCFMIDFQPEKVPTFYIQELLIHPSYRGQRLSKYLLEYCVYRCPKDKMYISLMTMPDNIPLQKVAESVGFIKQSVKSGDSKHSLLMIKNMDKVEHSAKCLSLKQNRSQINESNESNESITKQRSVKRSSATKKTSSSPYTSI